MQKHLKKYTKYLLSISLSFLLFFQSFFVIFNLGGQKEVSAAIYNNSSQFSSTGSGNGQFFGPKDIAVDSSGNIYITDGGNHRIQKFDSNGAYLSQFGSGGIGNGQVISPHGIAIDSNGDIYIADRGNDRIQKFDSNGTYLSQFGSSGTGNGQFNSPYGLTISTNTDIYVVDAFNDRIQKFSSNGTYLSQFGSSGSGNGQFDGPTGIALDANGNIYISDRGNDRIQKFDSNGIYISQFGSSGTGNGQFNSPYDLEFDETGNIHVIERSGSRIQKFDSNGTYISQFGSNGTGIEHFSFPEGVLIHSNGDTYVADTINNRFHRITNLYQVNIPVLLEVKDVLGNDIAVGTGNGLIGINIVNIENNSGVQIAETSIDMTTDRDWIGVTADSDTTNGKAFFHYDDSATTNTCAPNCTFSDIPGANGTTYDLYIPRLDGHKGAFICPGVSTLNDVAVDCSNGVYVENGTTETVGSDSVTLSSTIIGGQDYFVASGVSGTGGLSLSGFPGFINGNAFTLTPDSSPTSTTTEVLVEYVPSEELQPGDQIAIDFDTGGDFVLADCSGVDTPYVETLDADDDSTDDGSGAPETNGGANDDRYLYTFAGNPTTQASTNGIQICIAVTSPADAGNYQVDLVDANGDYHSELFYVADTNDVMVRGNIEPTLSFEIVHENDDGIATLLTVDDGPTGPWLCSLGTLTTSSVADCSYRLKVATNASLGYQVDMSTNGDLVSGVNDIDYVSDGTISSNSEEYGIHVELGERTLDKSTTALTSDLNFGASYPDLGNDNIIDEDSSITNGELYSSDGPNDPPTIHLGTEEDRYTALVTHKAAIDANTSAGHYTQIVTYTVTPSF